jgi:hypothetical protein
MTDTNSKAQVTGAVTQEYTLRAMANNYGDGPHSWDSLDKECCLKAADEIRGLRSALASYPSPIPRLPNCGRYIAQDNKGQWHYLNHAGTWQCYQGPALAAQEKPEPGVEVKKLKWESSLRAGSYVAHTSGVMYAIDQDHDCAVLAKWNGSSVLKSAHGSMEEAQAFAQSDYEQRILSALVHVPAVEPEPVGEACGLPGSRGGSTMAAFKAADVPIGTKLYSHPPRSPLDGSTHVVNRETTR